MNERTPIHRDYGDDVPLREYVERIFDEREKANNFRAKETEKALLEARTSADRAIREAKEAADRVSAVLTKRIEQLESGGAPFASRLDESLQAMKVDVDILKSGSVQKEGEEHVRLKHDVAVLNTDAVRSQVLDALREAQEAETKRTRKQVAIAVGLLALATLVNFVINLTQGSLP